MALDLTGLPSTVAIPGHYVEVRFAQGQSTGDPGTKKVLIMGPKISTGSATVDTQILGPIGSSDEALTYAGAGSIAHRMASAFLKIAGSSVGAYELYMLCPTEASGAKAAITITFATTATAAGVASVTIAGTTYSVPYSTGDTATVIADALEEKIEADPDCPCTFANTAGAITLTAKNKGTEGGTIRAYGSVTSGTAVTCDVTTSTALTVVASAVDFTNALATILGQKFDYIVPHCLDTTALDAIKSQVQTQALPATGFRQQVIAALCDSASNAATLGAGRNFERLMVANLESCEYENYVLAAQIAAVRVLNEISNPSFNYDSYGLRSGNIFPVLAPSKKGDWFTTTELSSMLANGITPIGVASNGQPYIVRAITTRCKNGSDFDYRVRDVHRVTVSDRFAADWYTRISTAGYSKITADPANQGQEPPAEFVTPRRAKAIAEQLISDYCGDGHLDPAKKADMIGACSVAVNATNASCLDIRMPLYAANLFHVSRTLIAESSAAA